MSDRSGETGISISGRRAALLGGLTALAALGRGYEVVAGDGGAWALGATAVFALVTIVLWGRALRARREA
jgi:hypothetical protein